jgi:threonine dehydratase
MGRAAVRVNAPFASGPPGLPLLRDAYARASAHALRTPLVRLPARPGEREVWLKLETLQPIGSFKIRGAASALGLLSREQLARGVFTASAGNMAQGVAWVARAEGVPCTVLAPDSAPAAKLDAIVRLGARVLPLPFERWWQVMEEHRYPGLEGVFVHPVSDEAVIAGNAGVGLEILEDLPGAAAVLVPYGGGGLSCGIAAALRASGSPIPVFACEAGTAAPLAASFAAGSPRAITREPSFVDGIGASALLAEMWPLARAWLAGSCVVSLDEIADAIRALATRARIVAEGAGASSLAVALSSSRPAIAASGTPVELPAGPMVCVVSGGNIDAVKLSEILAGRMP